MSSKGSSMKLSELQKLVNEANTMGFKPEEVEVKFTYTFSEMEINFMKSEVKAGKDVKPIVRIDLKC
jgi:hypothetical protein